MTVLSQLLRDLSPDEEFYLQETLKLGPGPQNQLSL